MIRSHNGYVLLQDGNGNFFVPEFKRVKDSAISYCQAFMFFAREIDKSKESGR